MWTRSGERPGIALLRALTKAAQARLVMISAIRDDPAYLDHTAETEPDSRRRRAADLAGEAARDFTTVQAFASDSIDQDVA